MNRTAIGWTDWTWNLFSGCKKVSPECAHCYADQLATQRAGTKAFPHGFGLTVRPHMLTGPAKALRSDGPGLIFCESMSDIGLDDDELTPAEVDRLFAAGYRDMDHLRDAFFRAIEEVPEHRYQLLTKRPHVLLRYFRSRCRRVPSCVWLGTTLGHPKSAGRLGELHTLRRDFFSPGTVAFLSCEPLLADLSGVLTPDTLAGIGWVIVGGESGTHLMKSGNGRALVGKVAGHPWTPIPLAVDIVRKLRDACEASGAAFFLKQWGGPRPDSAGRLLDGRTHDGMPDHLPGAMPPGRRVQGAATAALARKLPVVP